MQRGTQPGGPSKPRGDPQDLKWRDCGRGDFDGDGQIDVALGATARPADNAIFFIERRHGVLSTTLHPGDRRYELEALASVGDFDADGKSTCCGATATPAGRHYFN